MTKLTDEQAQLIDDAIKDVKEALLYLENDIREYRDDNCPPGHLLDSMRDQAERILDMATSTIVAVGDVFWCGMCGKPLEREELRADDGMCRKHREVS